MAVEAKPAEGAPAAAPEAPVFASQITKETREEFAEDLKDFAGKDVNELAREHLTLRRTVRERGIIIPNEKSSPEERKAFHERMGLPEKPEEYQFKYDEKVLPKEAVEAARAFVHKHGYTQNQAQAYVSSLESIARGAMEQGAKRKADNEANFMAALTREMGGDAKAAEAAHNLAVKYISSNHSPAVAQRLIDSGMAYDPQYLKEAAAVQARFEPHGRVDGDPGTGAAEKKAEQGRQGNYNDEWVKLYGKKGA
jgi:hypothetical protein